MFIVDNLANLGPLGSLLVLFRRVHSQTIWCRICVQTSELVG